MSDEVPPASLAEQQAALVAALVLGAAAPAGLDPARVEATRRQLLDKRSRVVAGCWPELAAAVGPAWRSLFGAWAQGQAPAGPRLEGYRFAVRLAHRPAADDRPETSAAVAAVLLDWRETAAGLRRRHGLRVVRVHGRWWARATRSGGSSR